MRNWFFKGLLVNHLLSGFLMTQLCCWPVTPALLCRPSCSFSSPLPQYDSRWLTVIGCPLYHHHYLVCVTSCFRWRRTPSPLCSLITSVFALLTHELCRHTLNLKWFGFWLIPFVWRKCLRVTNWSGWVAECDFVETDMDLHFSYSWIWMFLHFPISQLTNEFQWIEVSHSLVKHSPV